jgi:hypothetical protein
MVGKSIAIACMALLLLCSNGAADTERNNRTIAEYAFSDDTDGAHVDRYQAGYDRLFGGDQYLGFRLGRRNYHEDIATHDEDFSEIKVVGRKNFSEQLYAEGSLSLLTGDDWSPLAFTLNSVYIPNWRWRFEGYLEREVIDSIAAIEDENMFLSAGAVADYYIDEEYLVVGGLSTQLTRDDNRRDGVMAQFVYIPKSLEGFLVKLEARYRTAKFDPPEYFFPDSHEQYFVIFRYVTGLGEEQTWLLRAEAGPGVQYINHVREEALKYRLSLEGPLTQDMNLTAIYGCSSDGGSQDYEYCYASLNLSYYW